MNAFTFHCYKIESMGNVLLERARKEPYLTFNFVYCDAKNAQVSTDFLTYEFGPFGEF